MANIDPSGKTQPDHQGVAEGCRNTGHRSFATRNWAWTCMHARRLVCAANPDSAAAAQDSPQDVWGSCADSPIPIEATRASGTIKTRMFFWLGCACQPGDERYMLGAHPGQRPKLHSLTRDLKIRLGARFVRNFGDGRISVALVQPGGHSLDLRQLLLPPGFLASTLRSVLLPKARRARSWMSGGLDIGHAPTTR